MVSVFAFAYPINLRGMVSSPAQPASAATTPTTTDSAAAVMVEMVVLILMVLLTLLLNTPKVEKLQQLFHSLAIIFRNSLEKEESNYGNGVPAFNVGLRLEWFLSLRDGLPYFTPE